MQHTLAAHAVVKCKTCAPLLDDDDGGGMWPQSDIHKYQFDSIQFKWDQLGLRRRRHSPPSLRHKCQFKYGFLNGWRANNRTHQYDIAKWPHST